MHVCGVCDLPEAPKPRSPEAPHVVVPSDTAHQWTQTPTSCAHVVQGGTGLWVALLRVEDEVETAKGW